MLWLWPAIMKVQSWWHILSSDLISGHWNISSSTVYIVILLNSGWTQVDHGHDW